MFFTIVVLLTVLLTFSRPPVIWIASPGLVSAVATLVTLLPAGVAMAASHRARRMLERFPHDPGHGQQALSRGMVLVHGLLLAGHGGLLLATSWLPLVARVPVVGQWPVVPSLLAALPLIVAIALVWIAIYPADRAVRQIALEVYLLRGKPVRPVWSLTQFLVFNLRHQALVVVLPFGLILLARDLIERNEVALQRVHAQLPDMILGATAIFVALIAPVILRHVWETQRLPDGPLREKLLEISRRLRIRFREILVWKAGGMMVNAVVMGVFAPLRYVLITDGLLEQLEDRKIEAVFGHEAGHVKRHHIVFFLLLAFISGCLVTIVSIRTRPLDPALHNLVLAGLSAVLVFKWIAVFGWVSHRFERQADLFGVRALTAAGLPCRQPCAVHGTPPVEQPGAVQSGAGAAGMQPNRAPRGGLCSTAAHVFGDTLNQVAVLNGVPPEASSWRHPSISSRSRFVLKLAGDPAAERRFERNTLLVQLAILAVALVSGAWAAWEMKLWKLVTAAAAAVAL